VEGKTGMLTFARAGERVQIEMPTKSLTTLADAIYRANGVTSSSRGVSNPTAGPGAKKGGKRGGKSC
jgi:hypothetical protein